MSYHAVIMIILLLMVNPHATYPAQIIRTLSCNTAKKVGYYT